MAQSGGEVSCRFEKDTVHVTYGQTFSNKLHVQNNGNSAIRLLKQRTENTDELIPVPDTIEIGAHAQKVLPVKYLATGKNVHHTFQTFGIKLNSIASPALVISATFTTHIDITDQVLMQLLDPVAYVEPQTGLLSFRLKILNKGYNNAAIKLSVQTTGDLKFITLQHQINIEAGADTIIRFEAYNSKKNNSRDMVIDVTMESGTGKILANKQVSAMMLNSNKEFISTTNPLPENSIEILHTVIANNNSQYMLRGNGNIKFSADAKMRYNLNANYYTATGGYDVRDTYIEFDHKNIGVKAGTIAESLEMPVYGRGFKATGIVDKSRVSLYYVNNAYLLYSNLNQSFLKNAPVTWAGTYSYKISAISSLDASYIHQYDAVQKFSTDLMSAAGQLQLNQNQTIDVFAGYSWESSRLTSQSKQGYAGGFNYSGNFHAFEISSNNFLSSTYYSGLRRGTIQLNEQIGYNVSDNFKMIARFTHQKTQPQYIGLNSILTSYNNISTYELMLYLKTSRRVTMSVRPYIQEQKIGNLQFQTDFTGTVSAGAQRVAADLRYSISAANTLSLNADYGSLFNRQLSTRQNSFRLTLNYNGRLLGLNAFMQTGPYYLIDQYYLIYDQYNTNYTLSPYINLSLLKHKLTLNLANNLNYSKSSFNTFNSSYSGTAKWKVRGNWQLTAQVYYTRYENFDRQQTQLGIAKNFSLAQPNNHKLEITFFDDRNANSIQDAGEEPATGIRVSVNNNVAQSNDKGKVTYLNASSGWHQVVIVDSKGWSSSMDNNICIKKNTRLTIPLTRNSQLTGRIQPAKQKYQQKSVSLEGIRITATNAQNKTFYTLTDEQGNFSLSVPANSYTIYTIANTDTYTISNASQLVTVTTKPAEPVIFNLTERSQKVDVRRF
jgi:hypothetical protein